MKIVLILAMLCAAYYIISSIIVNLSTSAGKFKPTPFMGDAIKRMDMTGLGDAFSSIWEGEAHISGKSDFEFAGDANLSEDIDDNVYSGEVDSDIDTILSDFSGSVLNVDPWNMEGAVNQTSNIKQNVAKNITNKLTNLKNLKANDKNKSIISPKQLFTDMIAKNIITKSGNDAKAVSKLQSLSTKSAIPGEVAKMIKFGIYTIWNGKKNIKFTELLLEGENFVKNLEIWAINSPGLSRHITAVSVAGTPTVFSFGDNTTGQIPLCIPIFITLITSELYKLVGTEITVSLTGKNANGEVITLPGDSFFIFSSGNKTRLLVLPIAKIRETLFVNPLKPTNADPTVVTVTGLPADITVTTRLAGFDSEEWKEYKGMIGITI